MTTVTPITPTAPTVLSLDQAISVLFSDPRLGLLRLSTSEHEKYFRLIEGQWRGLDGRYESENWSGPALFIQAHPGSSVFFSSVLFKAAALGAHHPLTCLWVGLPVALAQGPPSEPRPRRVVTSAHAALERLHAAPLPPTLVLDEGIRVSAFWKLAEPLADLPRAQRFLTVLCRAFHGDSSLIVPSAARFGLPGSAVSEIFPRFEVSAERWSPEIISLDQIEAAYRMDP